MDNKDRYKRSVPDRPHAYSDYPSSVDLLRRSLKSEDAFIEKIAELLRDRSYSGEAEHRGYTAKSRAEKIFKDLESGEDSLNELEREIVSEAMDEGLFDNISFEEAWHPHNFLSDSCGTTFPLQHNTCVLYTGQNKRIFFSAPGKRDIKVEKDYESFTNPRSIFDQGFIARSDTDKTTSINDAVFFTFDYRHAADDRYGGSSLEGLYESSVVFEVEVPSKWVTICKSPTNNTSRFRSLQELKAEYSSPEEFRKRVVQGDNKSEEKIQFELENTGLPLEYITGVWDTERNDDPKFYTLEEYHEVIYSDFPFRVPWRGENVPWHISEEEARRKRVEKLKSKNVCRVENILEEVLKLSGEVIDISGLDGSRGLTDRFDGLLFRQKTLNGKKVPLGCDSCGNIFELDQFYCDVCGREIQEDWDKKFNPAKKLNAIERRLKLLKYLIDEPLRWRKRVRERWGDNYDEDMPHIFPWRFSDELAKETYLYLSSLERYISDIISGLENVEDNRKEKAQDRERVKAIKEDLKRSKNDLDRISS